MNKSKVKQYNSSRFEQLRNEHGIEITPQSIPCNLQRQGTPLSQINYEGILREADRQLDQQSSVWEAIKARSQRKVREYVSRVQL